MKKLYAPWRYEYVSDTARKKDNSNLTKDECLFCRQLADNNDAKYYILKRFNTCFAMMNLYPYNAGHLMILPNDHQPTLETLTKETRSEIMEVVTLSKQIIEKVLNAKGFNIGINLGIAGGGGLPSHLHVHVLPRWGGDTNFLETLGDIKLISADFDEVYQDLKKEFEEIEIYPKIN